MSISKRLRYEILRRDNHQCRYCGGAAPDVKLTVDHVTPKALGGADQPNNLVAACIDCNAGKSATPADAALVADIDQKAVAWAQAMNVVLAQRASELSNERKRISRFDRKWRSYRRHGDTYPRDVNWRNSVSRFLAEGLDDQFIADAVDTAMGRPRIPADEVWRYFCGVCWREIDEIRNRTSALVKADQPGDDVDSDEAELAAGFPFMEVFALLLDEVMQAGKFPEEAIRIARRVLWDGMWRADTVWKTRSFGNEEDDRSYRQAWEAQYDPEPDEYPSRYEMATEFLSGWLAHDMHMIEQIISAGAGTVPNGS